MLPIVLKIGIWIRLHLLHDLHGKSELPLDHVFLLHGHLIVDELRQGKAVVRASLPHEVQSCIHVLGRVVFILQTEQLLDLNLV